MLEARASPAIDLYLDLLEDSLLGVNRRKVLMPLGKPRDPFRKWVQRAFERRGWFISRWVEPNVEKNEGGEHWPEVGETMIGRKRMRNLRTCLESVLERGVPGDLIETGVWRGGATIYMRGILAAHGSDRQVWVADSFIGLPGPSHPEDAGLRFDLSSDVLGVSLEEVRDNFARYGLLDQRVRFVQGWFRDTLPDLAGHTWSVIRLDGDLYESTIDGLRNLYPDLAPGGYLIVDDYGAVGACKKAVHDYRDEHDISEPIEAVDGVGVFWRKSD